MDRSGEPALRLVIFDLDGVMYRGREPVPGAAALVAALHRRDLLIRFATNNSMTTRAMYVPRLMAMGVAVELDEIVTSTSATIDHLRAHLPEVGSVMAVGASGMLEELQEAGFDAMAAADAVDASYEGGPLDRSFGAVIAGLDPSFDFRRLAAATTAIRAGARFIATNADLRYPTPTGFLPGAGSIVAALRAASGEEPLVIGKPEPGIFSAILERAGVRPEEAVAIGDNPDADIVAAHRAGMRSILVLTGVADAALAATLDGERRPDQVARDPSDVASLLGVSLS
ncbi:MAG: HAD-IIA family hydrolase [Chloroflexi bacterium]|nr:HAD-IIA family hydrolase [Chloroflexota bacterium]